jgi:tetratricopeptide (TPR) repeat protein
MEPLSSSQRESLLQAYRSGTLQNPVALIALAKCRDYQDDETLTLVQEALKLAPHYSQALYMAAVIALDKGNIREGKSYSTAAMTVDPSLSSKLHLAIGRALHTGEKSVRDFNQAKSHYQQVIDTFSCCAHATKGRYWLARLYWDDADLNGTEGAVESAKKTYQKVLAIDPSFQAASFDLAILYMTENNRELAHSHFLSFLAHYNMRHELRIKKQTLPLIKELLSLVTKNPASNAKYAETVKDFSQILLKSFGEASWDFR